MKPTSLPSLLVLASLLGAAFLSQAQEGSATASAEVTVLGFTEPFRSIEVASPVSGLVGSILVKEGDRVTERSSSSNF